MLAKRSYGKLSIVMVLLPFVAFMPLFILSFSFLSLPADNILKFLYLGCGTLAILFGLLSLRGKDRFEGSVGIVVGVAFVAVTLMLLRYPLCIMLGGHDQGATSERGYGENVCIISGMEIRSPRSHDRNSGDPIFGG